MGHENRTVALVIPALALGGGIRAMASFLHRAISESGRYVPSMVSLATSVGDPDSVRLLSPRSWPRGARISSHRDEHWSYLHVGAMFAEFEFQRYRPRRVLTELLNRYDLIQVVAGTPAWALTTRDVDRPVCAFVASTARAERVTRIRRATGCRKLWIQAMTHLVRSIEPRATRHVAHVFAESHYTRRLISGFVEEERLSVGVPGVDTDAFHPASCRGDGYILSVGRFSDCRKNVRLLFEAYSRLRRRMAVVPRLVLAGSAPPEEDWALAVSLGIAASIEMHERVPRETLADLYRGATIFVLSSDEEGLGIVILEAMASGLPVISTQCGGPATAVVEGETGFLTPVGDPDALAERMQQVLRDGSLRQRMGKAGRRLAEERFSIAAAGRTYLEKYDALLGIGA